jgi:hypothetical protein
MVPLITCLSTELTLSVIRRSRPSSAISLDIGSDEGICDRGMCDSSSFCSCCVMWLLCAVTRSDSGSWMRSVQTKDGLSVSGEVDEFYLRKIVRHALRRTNVLSGDQKTYMMAEQNRNSQKKSI